MLLDVNLEMNSGMIVDAEIKDDVMKKVDASSV
jgi:hypothetical protein